MVWLDLKDGPLVLEMPPVPLWFLGAGALLGSVLL